MSKIKKTATRTLRIDSLPGDPIDVSVLRDFVKALDQHRVDGRIKVTGYRSEIGQLSSLAVVVDEAIDYDTAAPSAGASS